jgi:hypothetical protein
MSINPIPAAKDIRVHPKTEISEKLTQWRGDVTLFNNVSRPVPCKELSDASFSIHLEVKIYTQGEPNAH